MVAAIFTTLAIVAGCGSGAVSAPPATVTPGPIAITPATATLFSDLPSTFFVTGGNGNYVVVSSNQNALRVTGTFTGNELTVIPNQVATDTELDLTVTDTTASSSATAHVTVKPRTVNNVLTITPSATQPASCGTTAICAGGDATVKTVLTQNGVPLANRAVRFEVLSGDVRIITSPAGVPETTALSTTATTDNTGTATVRIRALTDAPPQTALLQVTDLGSGFIQRASITIAGVTGAALSASPSPITFQGTTVGTCASDISADVIVSGGRPPYQVSQPADFLVSPTVVTSNGGRFTITARGVCSTGTQIAVVDSAGATVTVNVINRLADTSNTTPFSVSPTAVTLSSCGDVANVILVGGTGSYVASSRVGNITASLPVKNPNGPGFISSISRTPNSGSPGSTTATVSYSDGRTVQDVQVLLAGPAANSCTGNAPDAISVSPQTVTLQDCTSTPSVVVSGGRGGYFASASNAGLRTQFGSSSNQSNILIISRVPGTNIVSSNACTSAPTPPPTPPPGGFVQCVTVSDGLTSQQIHVLIGSPATTCPAGP